MLFAKKRADGGIVNKIQPLLVPQLVSRFGLRWHNATVNCQVASILRNIVISHDVGGYAEHYDSLRAAAPEAEMKLVRHLRDSQAHAARNFRERVQYLVAALFNQSTDEAVNYVKQTVLAYRTEILSYQTIIPSSSRCLQRTKVPKFPCCSLTALIEDV